MKHLLPLLLCIYGSALTGQQSGDRLYSLDTLHEIRLTFDDPNFLQTLSENFDPFETVEDQPKIEAALVVDRDTVGLVGVRYKGYTSYFTSGRKKPLKIDLNEYVPGQRYDGLRKFNLNNSTGDPGMQRDLLCYEMMRRAGVPAPRVAFANVYLNDELWGVYQIVEQVDKEFLQNNYPNDGGNLFKNKDWNNFEYYGDERSDYDYIYQLKTNEDIDDWSGLANLMRVIEETPDDEFAAAINEVFDVDQYLRVLAVDVATNNWDSNLQHGRNWYLYEDTVTSKFHWIPWDYNLALDSPGFGSYDDCNLFATFATLTNGSDTLRCFDDINRRGTEVEHYWDFGDGNFSREADPVHVYAAAGIYEVCLTVSDNEDVDCSRTRCKVIDTSFDALACPSVVNGELPSDNAEVLAIMLDFFPEICEQWDEDLAYFLAFTQYRINNPRGGGGDDTFGFDIDQRGTNRTLISRLLAVPKFYEAYLDGACELVQANMSDEHFNELITSNAALLREAVGSDPNRMHRLLDFEKENGDGPKSIRQLLIDRRESLRAELDEAGGCEPIVFLAPGDVVINEFMAANDSTSNITDQDGDTDDWIELFNNTSEDLDLSDVYLSDDADEPLLWRFPAGTTLEAGGFLIVWADKDDDQAGLHADFKLGRDGESIYLSNQDRTVVDSVNFSFQETNVSLSRAPNGAGDFLAQHTTFGVNNDTPAATTNLARQLGANLFPNPAGDVINLELDGTKQRDLSVTVYAFDGRRVLPDTPVRRGRATLDLSSLRPGMYLAVLIEYGGRVGAVRFVRE